ncbi:TPA: hypothetical protein H1011_02130 [archaeon]|jgi:predicted  nucleic acid-binding Zn-ribbon protein|uniref:Zn-ribbon containing protein n=1 Tax=Candidatus Undinarchaeum marinum TaxID=2756141 RepID=A0A832X580_9ARCH|nr:hypothetical protein [Candidatus Undinarchaeum marinum]
MHKCLKCGEKFEEDDVPVVSGCSCGGRMFLLLRGDEDEERADEIYEELSEKIEEIKELPETQEEKPEKSPDKTPETENPKFGVETIRIKRPGVYEINIEALMKGRPIVVRQREGSFIISLPSIFGRETEIVLSK